MKELLKEKYLYASLAFGLVPYLYYLVSKATCGWDCPFYIMHLKITGFWDYIRFVEPLYFWIFKPLIWLGIDAVNVVKISQFAMILFFLTGIYLLARRVGLEPKYAALSLIIAAYTFGTFRLWSDTLRNFLMFSMMPYFLYFYLNKETRKYAYLMIIPLALSHRTFLTIVPLIFLYEIMTNGIKKAMKIGSIILILGTIINFVIGNQTRYWLPFLTLRDGLLNYIPDITIHNISGVKFFVGSLIFIPFLLVFSKEHKNPTVRFFLGYFMMFLFIGIFLDQFVAGRVKLMIGLPLAILGAFVYRGLTDPHLRNIKTLFMFLLVASIIPSSLIIYRSLPIISTEEIEFIENINIPKNSTLIVHSRMNFYTQSVWNGTHEIRTAEYYSVIGRYPPTDESLVYQGINNFGEEIYYVEADPWSPNKTWELKLVKLEAT